MQQNATFFAKREIRPAHFNTHPSSRISKQTQPIRIPIEDPRSAPRRTPPLDKQTHQTHSNPRPTPRVLPSPPPPFRRKYNDPMDLFGDIRKKNLDSAAPLAVRMR